jgi:hypothetical protein
MPYECEFCHNSFQVQKSLIHHQKSAKYCMELRGKPELHTCVICNKEISSKKQYESHLENCLANVRDKKIAVLEKEIQGKDETITMLQKQIANLQDKLKDVAIKCASKPTTTNILNLQSLTKDWLDDTAKNLTLEHIQRGPLGLAEFASENSFKNRVQCTDSSRQILQYKEEDSIIRDRKGKRLAKKFFESIQSQNDGLIREAMCKILEEMKEKPQEELDALSVKMDQLIEMKDPSKKKAEFVKELCDLL